MYLFAALRQLSQMTFLINVALFNLFLIWCRFMCVYIAMTVSSFILPNQEILVAGRFIVSFCYSIMQHLAKK